MNIGELFHTVFFLPILNVLVACYKLFAFLHIPGPLGFAIILLTVLIRLALYPLMASQLKSAKKMAELKPHLDALSQKHKGDKQALQQAQLALYKEHGVNPAAGCLPMLIQMPVLIALYQVFYQILNVETPAKILATINASVIPSLHIARIDPTFFGVNLGIKPGQWQTYGWWLWSVPVITAALQWYQTKLMTPGTGTPNSQIPMTKQIQNSTEPNKKEEKAPEDTAAEIQKQMGLIMPLMFGYFALQFPLGLALYWNVFGVMGIMQQLSINNQRLTPPALPKGK
ncbi:YidC/Oxa1 family membrane protein insertase [Patescibacteria group bacterium]|nr:YidC/Oxa1 family membrane protein insertase [Patescibacteria group bacterium]